MMIKKKGAIATSAALLAGVFAAALTTTGCIRSIVRVNSEPSDARVTINYVERGRTPIEIPILWYWYYKIRVEKDGYEPVEVDERFYAPPWAVWPLDLLTEALPIPIKNTYRKDYVLKPKQGD